MLYQVIQSGWLHEIEAPSGCKIARSGLGTPMLVIPGAYGEGQDEYLAPRVVVRAAKDHLFGLSRVRCRPMPEEAASRGMAETIVELGEV